MVRWLGSAFLAGAMVASIVAPAQTASPSGQYALKGVGQHPCGDYLEARQAGGPDYREYGAWIAGYISAANRFRADTVDLAPWQTLDMLAAYVANVCNRRTDAALVEAVEAVLAVLEPERIKDDARQITIEVDGSSRQVYESVIRRVQESLAERGLYDEPVDGAFGEATERAIRAFQNGRGIKETGLPDQRTLYLLFRDG